MRTEPHIYKRSILTVAFLFFVITSICRAQKRIQSIKNVQTKTQQNKNGDYRLLDGVDFGNSMINKADIELNHDRYQNELIENFRVNDLLDATKRSAFFAYLRNKSDDTDFKTSFFTKLLLLRIEQIQDKNAFFLLSEASKIPGLAVDGVELNSNELAELFMANPIFFIREASKNNEADFIKYIGISLNDFLVPESYFYKNIATADLKKGALLLNPKMEKGFSNKSLLAAMKTYPKVEVDFSPGPNTGWKSETKLFADVKSIFNEAFLKQLTASEMEFYKANLFPEISKYFISNYHVQDPDGFVNLREAANTSSAIKGKIKNGEYVCFMEDKGDLVLVNVEGAGDGFISKSRLVEQ